MKPKILVVDDDPSILSLIETILYDEGCDVKSVTNGADALALT